MVQHEDRTVGMDARSTREPKGMAARLRALIADEGLELTHSQSLEIVAKQLGFRDWNTCAAAVREPHVPAAIPILRVFPGGDTERFYIDFLGFVIDWEHRFEPGLPSYRQVSRDGCVLHLSEHHEDATPGSAVRIAVEDVHRLQRELAAERAYPLRIGVESQEWGDDLMIPDPFGNRLIFTSIRGARSAR